MDVGARVGTSVGNNWESSLSFCIFALETSEKVSDPINPETTRIRIMPGSKNFFKIGTGAGTEIAAMGGGDSAAAATSEEGVKNVVAGWFASGEVATDWGVVGMGFGVNDAKDSGTGEVFASALSAFVPFRSSGDGAGVET